MGEDGSGSEEEEQREASGGIGDNAYKAVRPNHISREEREKIKKLRTAFANYRPLDNMVSSIMLKYGLRLRETINSY